VPVVEQVKATLGANAIDLLVIDPFVSSHRVTENDNNAIDAVVKEWARIGDACNCAVELVHHARKTGGADVTAEDARGGQAFHDGTRSMRTLNRMTKDEAKAAGVGDRRGFYFRVDNATRMAPPAEAAVWYRLQGVDLGNATAKRPSDSVGVVVPWEWPDISKDVPPDALAKALAAIKGGQWREDARADNWIGRPIAGAIGLDPESDYGKGQVKKLIEKWVGEGFLIRYEAPDRHRKMKPHLRGPE
jgi:hypothetical protein